MDKCFDTIKDLVYDLEALYGKKASGLNLYKRLLDVMKEDDEEARENVLSGFREFCAKYDSCLVDPVNMIPKGTLIRYGQSTRVYLDIQKYLYQADPPERESIKQYLLCISALLNPTKEKLDNLKSVEDQDDEQDLEFSVNDGTPEGKFINDMMKTTTKSLKGMDFDPSNPTAMIAGLMQSGALSGFMDMIKGSMDGSKKLKPKRLLATIQNAMTKFLPEESDDESEEAKDNDKPSNSLTDPVDIPLLVSDSASEHQVSDVQVSDKDTHVSNTRGFVKESDTCDAVPVMMDPVD